MTVYPDIRLKKCTRPDAKPDWFEVAEDCRFGPIIISKGYVTDFASVPRILWSVFPPHGRMANASVKHDFRYDNRVYGETLGHYEARYWADHDFLMDMIRDGVPAWQSYTMYLVVRLFGKSWWDK